MILPERQLQLVTYQQQDNKFWYGSKINGALLRVESVDRNGNYHAEPHNDYGYCRTHSVYLNRSNPHHFLNKSNL